MSSIPNHSNGWYTFDFMATLPPPPTTPQPPLSWWQQSHKNRPQSNSIAGGLLLIASGAMHLAFGLWEPLVIRSHNHEPISYLALAAAMHVAAIAGGCVGAALVNRRRKRMIYLLCGAVHCAANALFIGLHHSYAALLIGRLLIGLAHGACYVCIIQHAGDNTAKEVRGRLLTTIGAVHALAAAVYIAICTFVRQSMTTSAAADWPHTQLNCEYALLGFVALALALTGMALAASPLTIESVLYLLQHQMPVTRSPMTTPTPPLTATPTPAPTPTTPTTPTPSRTQTDETNGAAEALMRLRNERTLTVAVHQELLELEQMVTDDSRLSSIIMRNGNTRPLFVLVGLRIVQWCTNNVMLNAIIWRTTAAGVYGPLVLMTVRALFAAAATLSADGMRRRFMAMQTFCGGCVLVVVAVLLTLLDDPLRWRYAYVYVVLFGAAQAFYGWAADSVQHVVAAEAFRLNKRAWSVAFASGVEHVVHTVTVFVYFTMPPTLVVHTVLLYVFGALAVAVTSMVFWHMPEARGLSLAECRNKYRGVYGGGVVYSRAYLGNLQREQAYKISVY